MRFSTTQTSFDTNPNTVWNQGRNNLVTAFYRGHTTDATATELFIDNISGRRLVPDRLSGGLIKLTTIAYNATSGGILYGETRVSWFVNAAGVITLTDQDSGTAGAQDNVSTALQGVTTRAGVLNPSVGADFGFAVDVVAASGTPGTPGFVPAYLRLRVRGTASVSYVWEVYAEVLETSATFN